MSARPRFSLESGRLRCEGDWRLPDVAEVETGLEQLDLTARQDLTLDTSDVGSMDMAGARLLVRLQDRAEQAGGTVRHKGHERHARLMERVASVARPSQLREPEEGVLSDIGRQTWHHWHELADSLAFVGATAHALLPALARPWTLRWRRLFAELEQAGVRAVPIVALLTFLVGIVISYQLKTGLEGYGGSVFLPELLTTTMTRELGPLIVAIVVAGRTASAYAAELGTMKINQEIDALRTLGVSPFDMLVIPKLLALVVALPLLTVLAGLAGMMGGVAVTSLANELTLTDFFNRLPVGMSHRHLWLGLFKTPVFAILIAVIGCRQGMAVQRGAEGVGQATTRAVVQAIFSVILINAVFSIFYNLLNM
jgi:phospholipid/cholesterol/gamma-HCH transport system permease protein